MCFWSFLGAFRGAGTDLDGPSSATIFDKKAKKSAQGGPKGTKSPEKGHPKGMQKYMPKKGTKSMSKGLQNDSKIDATSIMFQSKIDEQTNAKNRCRKSHEN